MRLVQLSLKDFRSYGLLHQNFEPGINYLIGENAAGKTNLIEAIYYLTLGRSFKKASDQELIRLGCKEAQVYLTYKTSDSIEHSLEARIGPAAKTILLDNERVPSVQKILGKLLCVVYSPQSVSLFRDSPAERRRVIDQTLSLLSPAYLYALTRQKKLLKERNAALANGYDEDVVRTLTNELVNVSYRIAFDRRGLVKKLSDAIGAVFSELFLKESSLKLAYVTDVPEASTQKEFMKAYLAKLERMKSEERMRKTTLMGVQKDDMIAYLDHKEVYAYASQGQNRLVSLALSLTIGDLYAEHFREEPIFLLDDVLSDLDQKRMEALFAYLKKKDIQAFITSTLMPLDREGISIYEIKDNQLERR